MITLYKNTKKLEYKRTVFSDTCVNVLVPDEVPSHIVWTLTDLANDTLTLGLIVNAYAIKNVTIPTLVLSYMPNARADRVFEEGNAFPLQVTCNFVNSLKFAEVLVLDPHSDVTIDFLNNIKVTNQLSGFVNTIPPRERTSKVIVCSPDKGALEKTTDIALYCNLEMVIANKVRDVTTGKILDTQLGTPELVKGRPVIICDDICDGGGTFIPLAKKLKEAGAESVYLYVTHGIFAKGLEPLEEYIDKIYVNNLLPLHVTTFDIQKFNARNT